MRILSGILFLFFFIGHSQSDEIALTLDSIVSVDNSSKKRIFTIHYQIQNKTAKRISFILNPHSIRSNVSNSLAWMPSYRLYQNSIRIDVESISSPQANDTINKEFIDSMQKELRENKANLEEYLLQRQKKTLESSSKNIINSILTFEPKESRSYSVSFNWDKNRYVTHYDNEYYLDEKTPHYMDIVVILMKDELYSRLLPEDQLKIESNKTILRGWLNSNKIEINFKD
jgi:hypothetical protein